MAAYGHANVDIDNRSAYKLIMNEVDTTHDRVGEIILIDSSLQTKTIYTRDSQGVTETHYAVDPAHPLLTGDRGEVSGLNYQLVGETSGLTGANAVYHPGAYNQVTGQAGDGQLYYVWVEGQEKTRVVVTKFEKKSFNLFGDNAFGDLLVKDSGYEWQTTNFRDAQPILESEVVYKPTFDANGQVSANDPLGYIAGQGYTIEYSQEIDRDVDLVPGQTVIRAIAGSMKGGTPGNYYRFKSSNTATQSILKSEDYSDTTRWDNLGGSGAGINPQFLANSDYVNQSQSVRRWTTAVVGCERRPFTPKSLRSLVSRLLHPLAAC